MGGAGRRSPVSRRPNGAAPSRPRASVRVGVPSWLRTQRTAPSRKPRAPRCRRPYRPTAVHAPAYRRAYNFMSITPRRRDHAASDPIVPRLVRFGRTVRRARSGRAGAVWVSESTASTLNNRSKRHCGIARPANRRPVLWRLRKRTAPALLKRLTKVPTSSQPRTIHSHNPVRRYGSGGDTDAVKGQTQDTARLTRPAG